MDEVGLREMRQNASELVRRAEAGETMTITVAGRPAATLGPVSTRQWQTWGEVADVFRAPTDPGWAAERDAIDQVPVDPWERG